MWSDEEDWPLFMGIFASVTAGTKGFRKNVILSDGLSLLRDKSAGLLIKRLRVQIPAGAAGECFLPELTLCADSYSVSVSLPCYRNAT